MKNETTVPVRRGRGRPSKDLILPEKAKAGHFTVNDLVTLNPHIECRLSIYTKLSKLAKKGVVRYTGETERTGGVGKPLDVFQTMESYRRSRAAKKAAKSRKLGKITVDLTPPAVPAPVVTPEPVAVS